MAQTARQTFRPEVPAHTRRDDLIRRPEVRRDFPVREAQRHLRQKERKWAPIAYAVFLAVIVFIFCSAYTTYAFSKYKDVILPGVHIDVLPVGGMTEKQAARAIYAQLRAIYYRPVSLTYGAYPPWKPKDADIGVTYDVTGTIREAQAVGRNGGFFQELLDRLPIHPLHTIPMQFKLSQGQMDAYLRSVIAAKVHKDELDASLQIKNNHVTLVPSQRGLHVDVPRSEQAIQNALGHLSRQTVAIQVDHVDPVITDEAALRVENRVERFLASPPIIKAGKLRVVTSRADFAPMLNFHNVIGKNKATIQMKVSYQRLQEYIAQLAGTVDRPAENPRVDFSAGQVRLVSPRRTGRTLLRDAAYNKLVAVVTALKPGAHLKFAVSTIQPPVDTSNPASLGINTLLASASTSFQGADPARLSDITQIAKALDGDLLPPKQDISFNTLTTTSWDPRVYQDDEAQVDGKVVPGPGGAMQQVATTFLRALFQAGLQLKERHAHSHRLSWYEPPVGLDAIVSPDRIWDLVFNNNSGKYLFIKTRVEPVRQEVYVYVYGPKLGWSVAVDKVGKVTKTFPHGPKVTRQDPTLSPGQVQQIQWAHDGADVVIQRTITYPDGKVQTDNLYTTYRPWQAIVLVGSSVTPTPTATPLPSNGKSTPTPVPTPTFSH